LSNHQKLDCFICSSKVDAYRYAMSSNTEFLCDYCGNYGISDLLLNEKSWIRPIMLYCLLHSTNDAFLCFVEIEPKDKGSNTNVLYITKDYLVNAQPKNVSERIDMIMLNLGTKIKKWGDTYEYKYYSSDIEFLTQSWLLLLCTSSSNEEVWETFEIIIELGYLKRTHKNVFTFTADGWKHLGQLQSKQYEHPQAFIAMRFSDEMNDARDSIKKAILDSGYIPIIIDEKEHNNQIVPEIFYEIQKSKFLIADLTHHRNGVYYEAGYAQGLGKEVILTCRKDEFKERHFDVAQISTIDWSDENDLYTRLLRRIEATVGVRKK